MNIIMHIDSKGLPSILEVLGDEAKNVRFVRPTLGNGIVNLNAGDLDYSPGTTILSIRSIEIGGDEVIPFHQHEKKEKVYFLSRGGFTLYLWNGGEIRKYHLKHPEDRLVIPPKVPHAVFSPPLDGSRRPNKMLVIASSTDSQIDWEDGIAELLLNKHLATT